MFESLRVYSLWKCPKYPQNMKKLGSIPQGVISDPVWTDHGNSIHDRKTILAYTPTWINVYPNLYEGLYVVQYSNFNTG